ncbi:nucleolar complex protein 2 homolog [Belonocnema kinseyi]|uniref:nucleolar complex protein 2 homolog n=1 Tax=Belonocnema kinseyi TaxID=2817044 RepID=UPI00143CD388|nr:nucleolar complex protein 2 homolog [Belonocnema kinseyi]XP_033226482.1 nucleolar complex protein 2 homolog [Belonocnema kinseyi]
MKLKKDKIPSKKLKKSKKNGSSKVSKRQKRLSAITMDEFLEQDFEDDDSGDDVSEKQIHESNDEAEAEASDSGESDLDPEEHKKSLMKLKDTDPEFYSFLKQNDKNLLDFDVSDNEECSDDENDSRHIPNANLEIASDESDYEPEEGEAISSDGPMKVTLKLLRSWQESLQKDKTTKTIKIAVEVFHAAIATLGDKMDEETNKEISRYKVDGSAVFNGVVQMCVMNLPEAFKRFLNLGSQTRFEAHKAKKFVKVKGALKSYLTDLIKLLRCVTSEDIIAPLLKHLHQMLPFTQCYSSLRKPLLKILLKFWSSGEETVRIVAFLCILQIATSQKESVLETLLKTMYIKYVQNSHFVKPSNWPGINFMRRSLTEIYLLDSNFSYSHAFLFVRQLAIHLRNALTLKKKENFNTVYNWQYINSLKFWAELIALSKPGSMMRQLLYPLVQIIIGTIKMVPTSQYYPLRFHCVKMLIDIAKESGTFIPILPFLLEVLSYYDFNKKHKVAAMKPKSLLCLLKISKSEQQENTFKDSIIENIYELILENAANESYKIYFPDAYIPCIIQLKSFLKKCNVANYSRKMKQLLDKIEENRKFVEKERSKATFDFKNMKEIQNWEIRLQSEKTPLVKFYDSWYKVNQSQKMKLLTQNDEEADFKLPLLRKSKGNKRRASSEDDSDLDMPVEEFERRQEKKKQKKKMMKGRRRRDEAEEDLPRDNTDIVKDMKMGDWD